MLEIIDKNHSTYDVVVVGSGAAGGWAAKILSESGMTVAVLEAGAAISPADFSEHIQPYELKYRGQSPHIAKHRAIQSRKYACRESNYHWFVNDVENPYTASPSKPFQWTRCRVLGGRTMTWGRQSYRFSDLDFKAASRDGYGVDWPISYRDLEPYYEKIEKYVGISGQKEGLPHLPDSIFLPPMKMTLAEKYFRESVQSKLDIPITIGRTAMLTREHNGRSACHYCGPCEQGCLTSSYFNSAFTTISDAVATGRTTILTNSVASHVTRDRSTGLASGVSYIDRLTRSPREIRGRVVVLCASALESVRLLLNSGTGFANSSGLVGHYVMDHASGSVSGTLPIKETRRWFGPPRRANGIYIPRFQNLEKPHDNGVIRGYGYQGSGNSTQFSLEELSNLPGFGQQLKESAHQAREIRLGLASFVECLPRYENFVELDKNVVDAWGIPALRMNVSWGGNENRLISDATEWGQEMLSAAGATDISVSPEISIPGGKTHEIGGARMGTNRKLSVVNEFNQTHDINNLFVADGGAFVTSACQNPTLTLMALTARACEYIVEQHSKGQLG